MKAIDLISEFKNPSSQFRSLPFWAWNDKLDKDELIRQICEMKAAGAGGFFMHSRDGLETPYLGKEWLECIKVAVDEAKKCGIDAWLYDEDRWPSGSCGGKVSRGKGCKGLTLEVCKSGDTKNAIALYAACVDGMEIHSLRRIDNAGDTKSDEVLLIARLEISEGSEWFNNSPPPDNLSFDEVAEFIESTHERYSACMGDEFGKTVKGIFTDEPSLADRHAKFNPNRGWIPWTVGFDEYYKSKRGTDVFDTLPYIYFNGDKSKKARHDYWQTVSERFLEAYSMQIGAWCRENNIAYTGHFLQEDKLGLACRVSGSIMPHYALQDVPSIDLLTNRTVEYLTVKQCVSVASQLGKDTVLSEMYGCTGWDFSFADQKYITEWQYALGINGRCQHLALYSLRGCRKRDYPPSINCNAPWWKYYSAIENYFARLSFALRQGRAVRKVLVIHPMSTVWSNIGCNPYGNPVRKEERDVPAMNALGDKLNELIKKMCHKHIDCDLGDEAIISEYGSVADKFNVGQCSYDTVILPYCETLLSSTAKLLTEFMDNGGRVIGLAPVTVYIEGEKADVSFMKHKKFICLSSEEEFFLLLEPEFEGHENILYQLRHTDDGEILYLFNTSKTEGHEIKINKNSYQLSLTDGEIYKGEKIIHLAPCESVLLYITDKEMPIKAEEMPQGCLTELKLCGYKTDKVNVLTLDRCRYFLDGKKLGEAEIWKAQCDIRKRLDMRQIHLNGIEQRYRWINEGHENDGHELVLEMPFESKCSIKEACLIIERSECFEISLDGRNVGNKPEGYFFDKAFECVQLGEVGEGKHILNLKCRYTNDMELENCYIAGEFGVDKNRRIVKKPQSIELGSITDQGFYHYTGDIEYIFKYESEKEQSVYVEKINFKGICAVLAVNGEETVIFGRAKINLKKGTNRISIKVCSGFRNMLGPLHLKEKPTVTKDSSFCAEGKSATSDYIVEEVGLYSLPKMII